MNIVGLNMFIDGVSGVVSGEDRYFIGFEDLARHTLIRLMLEGQHNPQHLLCGDVPTKLRYLLA